MSEIQNESRSVKTYWLSNWGRVPDNGCQRATLRAGRHRSFDPNSLLWHHIGRVAIIPSLEKRIMATDPRDFDDILNRFDKLSPEEREQLLNELEQRQATSTNGHQDGRSALDGFKERGLLGSITDAPTDWSTNPKYMEGFGQDAE